MTSAMNDALMRLTRRAEVNDPESLVQTFVNVGPLLTLLTTRDHQLIFGRRGTGKTHALTYLAESKRSVRDEEAVFIDMRSIGSSGGLYADSNLPVTERGTRLLVDALSSVQDRLVDLALTAADRGMPGGDALTLLSLTSSPTTSAWLGQSSERQRRSSSMEPRTALESLLAETPA